MSVAIVVHPGAAGVPARFGPGLQQSRAFRNIGESSVAVVVIQSVLSVVRDEQIVPAVVVVIADTAGLSPTGAHFEARTLGDVGKRAVAIIFEEPTMRFVTLRKSFETPAVH